MAAQEDRTEAHLTNPFIHRLDLSLLEKLKVAVVSATLLPIRVFLVFLLLVIAWFLGFIGHIGYKDKLRPMRGWRSMLKPAVVLAMRMLFIVSGFHWVSVKGKQATPKEALILAVAPHSSFFDALPLVFMGAPSPVVKAEAEKVPFFGTLMNYIQPVYVSREDPDSRQNTIKEIRRRALSEDNWPQIIIFPEGTCTNRTGLISFKAGAFYPGVPIQPVCIRYPNKIDTVTWTWDGPGALKLLWLTFCQFHTYVEIEFLPVYRPSEEEIRNPKLFAQNVRLEMAKCLQIPVTEHAYRDCISMMKFFKRQTMLSSLVEILGFDKFIFREQAYKHREIFTQLQGFLNMEDFSCLVDLPVSSTLTDLFMLYDKDGTGSLSLDELLVDLSLLWEQQNPNRLELAFQLFDNHVTRDQLALMMKRLFMATSDDSNRLYDSIDKSHCGYIIYEQLRASLEEKPLYEKLFRGLKEPKHHKSPTYFIQDGHIKAKWD